MHLDEFDILLERPSYLIIAEKINHHAIQSFKQPPTQNNQVLIETGQKKISAMRSMADKYIDAEDKLPART